MQLHGYQIDGEQADKGVVTILDPDGNDARWNAEALRETIRQHRRIEEPRESTVQWIAVLEAALNILEGEARCQREE